MILSFELSMPGVNTWNGHWSGEDKHYVIVHHFGTSKKATARAQVILDKSYYHYSFGDGWRAGISVKRIDSKQARELRSDGFCGYDWMVRSILDDGDIYGPERAKPQAKREDKP